MGMPRKGSRRVDHDGHVYLWRIKDIGESKRYHGVAPTVLRLTIQRDDPRPGRVCQVELCSRWAPSDLRMRGHWATLYPTDVKEIIAMAIEGGWDPDERGGAFVIPGEIEVADYYSRTRPTNK